MIIFVRHGETKYNTEDRFQGVSDSPLTATGRQQAERIGKVLTKFSPDITFISPLKRVYDSFKIMTKTNTVPFIVREELSEICYGEWETMRKTSAKKTSLWSSREKNPFHFIHPGEFEGKKGESYHIQEKRLGPFFEEIIKMKDRSILVVSHLGIMRSVYNYFNKSNSLNTIRKIPNNMVFSITGDTSKFFFEEMLA